MFQQMKKVLAGVAALAALAVGGAAIAGAATSHVDDDDHHHSKRVELAGPAGVQRTGTWHRRA